MSNNSEGRYICGYCKKETPLDDETLPKFICGEKPEMEFKTPCSCGHFSYASSIKCNAILQEKDWKIRYGSLE